MALGEKKLTQSLALLLLAVVLSGHVGALTVDDLYPFGPANGDTLIVTGDDVSSGLIPLPYAVPVFGTPSVKGAYVYVDGAVHFQSGNVDFNPENPPFPILGAFDYSMVAAFGADLFVGYESDGYSTIVDDDCNGNACTFVAYRAVDDASLLADITSDIRGVFPDKALAAGFTAESALIATWYNVSECCTEFTLNRNTFQAVIVFNARTVFVGLLYPALTFGGPLPPVQAGFNLGDGVRSFRLPSSLSVATFDKNSNVGQAGKWWFGLDSSKATIGTFNYLDDPLPSEPCQNITLYGDTGVDACGNQQTMDWDSDNDGAFNDNVANTRLIIDTQSLRLTPGTYPISARVRSASPCPGASSDQLVLSTNLILTKSRPEVFYITLDPATGNVNPAVSEAISVVAYTSAKLCNDFTETIACGIDSIAEEPEGTCRYSTPGVKNIIITITQNGLTSSKTTSIRVVEYKQACSPAEYPPNGRAVGRRGCSFYQWTLPSYTCNYPVRAGIKPSTRLWVAFASRAAQDAAVIRRFYGNRTMIQTLRGSNNEADSFAREAATALLNALTLPYPQCPLAVKLEFRHALYRGLSSTEARTVYFTFLRQNNPSEGCTLPLCEDNSG